MFDDSDELLALSGPFVNMLTQPSYGSHMPYSCPNCQTPNYGMMLDHGHHRLPSQQQFYRQPHHSHESEFKQVLELGTFKPEDIKVNVVGHVLMINGERKEEGDNFEHTAKFARTFNLPKGIDPESVTCHLKDGNKLEILGIQKVGNQGWKRSINIPIETDEMRKRLTSDATKHGFEKVEHDAKKMQVAEIPGEHAHEIPIEMKQKT